MRVFLYFWNNEVNVGDYASQYIVSHIACDKVVEKNPFIKLSNILYNLIKYVLRKESHIGDYCKHYLFIRQRVVFSVGSILDFATSKCIVWGSGFREYNSVTSCRNIVAVRGYLSLHQLKNISRKIMIGDPALLLPLIYTPISTFKKYTVSLIPHYKDYHPIIALNTKQYNVIKTQTENVEQFIEDIYSSQYILSSSLHGVIIAHAYNIPALWVRHGNVGSSDFKYHDYFSSVHISSYPSLCMENIINYEESDIVALFDRYRKYALPQIDILQLQQGLLSCAPFKIKNKYTQYISNN